MENIQIEPSKLKAFNKYTQTSRKKAIIQLLNSFLPFIGLWILMYLAYDYSYWLTLALGAVNAFFMVRIFIIQHDCGHRNFVRNTRIRNAIGYISSIFSTIPYGYWAKSHHIHHSHNGQLEMRDIGDINTLTVKEYQQLSTWGRIKYRIFRSWPVMFVIGPIYYVLIHNRLPLIKMDVFKNERKRLWINNLILVAIFLVLGYYLGWVRFFVTHFTIIGFFSVIAIWFFYVQHQHEEAYKQWRDKWDYMTAALRGSTYYKVPKLFNWLTGNIGIHHIHHLNPAIPNYNLQKALKENQWVNDHTTILSFWDSLKLVTHKLWDESQQRMISFREFYRLEKAGALA